jgi:hypothetical protein
MSGNFWLKKTPAEGRGGQRQAVRSARSRSRKASSLGNKKAASLGGLPKR